MPTTKGAKLRIIDSSLPMGSASYKALDRNCLIVVDGDGFYRGNGSTTPDMLGTPKSHNHDTSYVNKFGDTFAGDLLMSSNKMGSLIINRIGEGYPAINFKNYNSVNLGYIGVKEENIPAYFDSEGNDYDIITTNNYTTVINGFAEKNHNHDGSYVNIAANRIRNTVLAAPDGSDGPASFRLLTANDIPAHTHNNYLSTSGGTLNGLLTLNPSTNDASIAFNTGNYNVKLGVNSSGEMYIVPHGTNTKYNIVHLGNYTEVINGFAEKNHNHDSSYIRKDTSFIKNYVLASPYNTTGLPTFRALHADDLPTHNHTISNITDLNAHIYDASTSRSANTFLAAPNGSEGKATFRSIVLNDIPTISAAKGGTGQTSLVNSANALINALSTQTSVPVDNDYYISQDVSGGISTTTYHRRPMSALYEYVSGKLGDSFAAKSHNHDSSYLNINTSISKNLVYASPATATGKPEFRSLLASDLPTIPVTKGGTGVTDVTTTSALTSAMLNTLSTESNTPTGTDYYIGMRAKSSASTYYRKPLSTLLAYIKNNISVGNSEYCAGLRDPDYHSYANRRTTPDIHFNADGALHYFLATASMSGTTEGHILHFDWDNTAGSYLAQLLITHFDKPGLKRRYKGAGNWSSWIDILDANNYTDYCLSTSGGTLTGQLECNHTSHPHIIGNGSQLSLYYSDTGDGIVIESGCVRKKSTATTSLGTSTYRWDGLYSTTANLTGTLTSYNILPAENLTYNIGSSSKMYNKTYTRYIDTAGSDYSLGFCVSGTEGMNLTASKKLFIGGDTSPKYTLHVNGEAHATDFIVDSDKRLKTNFTDIINADKSLELQFYEFDYIKDNRHSYGHIAQDVEEIFPDIVAHDNSEDDYLSLNYTTLHTIQIKALLDKINNLTDIVNNLQNEIRSLKSSNVKFK